MVFQFRWGNGSALRLFGISDKGPIRAVTKTGSESIRTESGSDRPDAQLFGS